MKTQNTFFPVRSLIPSLLCAALAFPVIAFSHQAAAAVEPISVVAMADKIQAVSINSANAAAIADAMRGVGIKKAQAIVEWRNKNGKFTSIEQLLEVKGIGEKTLAANKGRIKL